jgi:hypothetical protein
MLESIEPGEDAQILARIVSAGRSVRVEPITLWQTDKPHHFTLGTDAGRTKQQAHTENWLEGQNEDPLTAQFDLCLENLVASSEAGSVTPARRCDEIEELVNRLHGSGSELLANSLADWIRRCREIRKQANPDLRGAARGILKSAYLHGLYTRAQMLNQLG